MDELGTIRTFLAVARNRSFAEAARELRTPPATVTRAVSSLEKTLGTQLLVRTTRQVSLTSAGAAYAARVEPLVQDIDGLTEDFRSGAEAELGAKLEAQRRHHLRGTARPHLDLCGSLYSTHETPAHRMPVPHVRTPMLHARVRCACGARARRVRRACA